MARLTEYDVRRIVREEMRALRAMENELARELRLKKEHPEAEAVWNAIQETPYKQGIDMVYDVLEAKKKIDNLGN